MSENDVSSVSDVASENSSDVDHNAKSVDSGAGRASVSGAAAGIMSPDYCIPSVTMNRFVDGDFIKKCKRDAIVYILCCTILVLSCLGVLLYANINSSVSDVHYRMSNGGIEPSDPINRIGENHIAMKRLSNAIDGLKKYIQDSDAIVSYIDKKRMDMPDYKINRDDLSYVAKSRIIFKDINGSGSQYPSVVALGVNSGSSNNGTKMGCTYAVGVPNVSDDASISIESVDIDAIEEDYVSGKTPECRRESYVLSKSNAYVYFVAAKSAIEARRSGVFENINRLQERHALLKKSNEELINSITRSKDEWYFGVVQKIAFAATIYTICAVAVSVIARQVKFINTLYQTHISLLAATIPGVGVEGANALRSGEMNDGRHESKKSTAAGSTIESSVGEVVMSVIEKMSADEKVVDGMSARVFAAIKKLLKIG